MLRPRPLVALLSVLAVALTLVAPAAFAGDDANSLRAQYDEVLGKEAELQARVDAAAARRVELLGEIAQVNQQLTATDLRLITAERELATALAADRKARAELTVARRRLAVATAALHAQAVSSYMRGSATADPIGLVLTEPDDATAASRTMSYAQAIVEHQHDVVVEFRVARAATDRLARRAAAFRQAATDARDTIATAKVQLQGHRLELASLDRQTREQAALQEMALTALRGRKLEIEARITSLEKESDGIALQLASIQAGQPDYRPGTIQFVAPVPGARIGSPFGMRFHPILHYERLHAGADIGAGSGTPIHAAADGTVVIAAVRGGYGNATVIDHGNAMATLYGHQSQILVHPGQQVKKGDVIGAVGSTGLSTGPHLHFETRLRGTPVNPESVFDLGPRPVGSAAGD